MHFWIPFTLGALMCALTGDAHPRAFLTGFAVMVAAGALSTTQETKP